MSFWQNAITDMFDTGAQLKRIDKIIEQSLSSMEEFSAMIQKLGPWNSLLNPLDPSLFDFRVTQNDYLKTLGLISIEEYRSLVKQYEDLKKESKSSETAKNDHGKKIDDLNKAVANEKKKLTAREKALEESKAKLEDMKKQAESLKTDLAGEKKQSQSLQSDLAKMKKEIESLKKEISEKDALIKKTEKAKA
jgi:chromosome segregation ATPase